jgi:hypothetical protein
MQARRPISLLLASAMAFSPVACRDTGHDRPPPAVDDTRGGQTREPPAAPAPAPERPRISTRNKVIMLAGAAALYYLYRKHKSATAPHGIDGQYYLSKNGRVYYRDAEHRAHWVTPPPGGIAVPEAEAAEYRDFQGYNNQPTGRDLSSLVSDPDI